MADAKANVGGPVEGHTATATAWEAAGPADSGMRVMKASQQAGELDVIVAQGEGALLQGDGRVVGQAEGAPRSPGR